MARYLRALGKMVNVDHIVYVHDDHDGHQCLALSNGEQVKVGRGGIPDINEYIPANPGFERVFYWLDGDVLVTSSDPVLAWASEGDGYLYPVTIDGVDVDNGCPWAIRYPDGRIAIHDGGTTWTSLAAAEPELIARAKAEAARLSPKPKLVD